MDVNAFRADGSLVTCSQLFPNQSEVTSYKDMYLSLYTSSLLNVVSAIQLSKFMCGGVSVPAAGFGTELSSNISSGRQLMQSDVIPLVMSQHLTFSTGTAPNLALLVSVAALQSVLSNPLSRFFKVNTTVASIISIDPAPSPPSGEA